MSMIPKQDALAIFFVIIFVPSIILVMILIPKPDLIIKKPSSLNYDECSITKFSTITPFMFGVFHKEGINQDILVFHEDKESIYVWKKTSSSFEFRSEDSDIWYIQLTLQYNNSERRNIIIEYNIGEQENIEMIKDNSPKWCRIFEITSNHGGNEKHG